jgi:hypothetical protein
MNESDKQELELYRSLEKKGLVYYVNRPEKYNSFLSYKELLYEAIPEIDHIHLTAMLKSCTFKTDETAQWRKIESKNIHRTIMEMSKQLAELYKKDYNRCAPRVKAPTTTEAAVNCRSNIHNIYPPHYVEYVKNYLNKTPLSTWKNNKEKTIFPDCIQEKSNDGYKCTLCDTHLFYQSIKKHLKSKTHIKILNKMINK